MEKISISNNDFTVIAAESACICINFKGKDIIKNFWVLTCPCGVSTTYALNELPEVNTLSPCGNPNHWLVKYYDQKVSNDQIA